MMDYHKGGITMSHIHVHQYEGATTCNLGHTHTFAGVSGPAIQRPDGRHVHIVQGRTSFENNHYHEYSVYSGPDVDLPGGFHVHPVTFQTTVVLNHSHMFTGFDMAAMHERMS